MSMLRSTHGTHATSSVTFQGNDRLLVGFILGLIGFWLFSQTILNTSTIITEQLGFSPYEMNLAVAASTFLSGLTVVLSGSLADRYGRIRWINIGFLINILGALLIFCVQAGAWAAPMLIAGRMLQGLAIGAIMPASLALLKVYWQGQRQQRAISLWSLGSWGGGALCALVGGAVANLDLGAIQAWRLPFVLSAMASVIGFLLVRGTPEHRAQEHPRPLDVRGIILFMLTLSGLLLFASFGAKWGWSSITTKIDVIVTIVSGLVFVIVERRQRDPFIDFSLLSNKQFTGATVSNMMFNSMAGFLIMTQTLLQLGCGLEGSTAGYLTIGYAVCQVAFIRVGEVILRKLGARKPMIWGCLLVMSSIVLLAVVSIWQRTNTPLVAVAYTLFGIGMALYATPSTSVALINLPQEQAGAGAGIYKMASSLGGAFGVVISMTIFSTIRQSSSPTWISGFLSFADPQTDLAVREAGAYALLFHFISIAIAVLVILYTIPPARGDRRR